MLASNVMTKDQMLEQYEVLGFFYDVCFVKRKSDGVKGTLQYTSRPVIHADDSSEPIGWTRYYYNFVED
jgi:hypothetical protein